MSLMEHYQSTGFEETGKNCSWEKTQGHWPEREKTREKDKERDDKVPPFSTAQKKPQIHLILLDKAT